MAMGIFPTRYKLPQKHCTEIGRIVSRFAVLESKLAKCAYVLLDVSPKQGRIAVRMGRISSAVTVLQDLLTASGLTIRTDLKKIKAPFEKLENARDLVAHGVWVKHSADKEPVVQHTSGSYAAEPGGPTVKARINPQGIKVTVHDLRSTVRNIDAAVRAVDAIGHQIDLAKKQKQREQRHVGPLERLAQGYGGARQTQKGQ